MLLSYAKYTGILGIIGDMVNVINQTINLYYESILRS